MAVLVILLFLRSFLATRSLANSLVPGSLWRDAGLTDDGLCAIASFLSRTPLIHSRGLCRDVVRPLSGP